MAPPRQFAEHPWSSCEVQNERMIGINISTTQPDALHPASPQYSARWRACNAVGIACIAHLSEPAGHLSARGLGSRPRTAHQNNTTFLSHLSPGLLSAQEQAQFTDRCPCVWTIRVCSAILLSGLPWCIAI